MKQITVPAKDESLDEINAFVESELEDTACSPKTMIQLEVAIEEIFVNIAHYAYEDEGTAVIKLEKGGSPMSVAITFEDTGMPFDPLAKEDPDVTLSAEERRIGGLGIFMVKKSMDDVQYRHEDGKNILTIRKQIEG
ncbi:MAG: ATP-binding protein [Lachnospiraceae bacterium]|nr:ATP-binding protein [Lachnospiraceae bacterium]